MAYYLIGHPLGHSCSPELHSYFGNDDYSLRDLQENELKDFIQQGDFDGLNVTIPFKTRVAAYMDVLSPRARETGAVNTVVRTRDGRLMGDNTDIDGMESLIRSAGIELEGKYVLILGTGGTAHTANYIAHKHGASKVIHVSRTGSVHYQNVYDECADAEILINTTPVGMYPDLDGQAVDLERFGKLEAVIDVVYNPLRTALTQQARRLGIPHVNGLNMLVEQAKAAEELFFARTITEEESKAAYDRLLRRHTNIVLIGMPGCGKTSIGREISALTGRPLVDLDAEIAEAENCSVPDIINTYGEAHFRDLETRQVRRFAKESGLVIACGGGTPLREINRRLLRQNGKVFFLHRDLALLPTDGRPLSVNLEELTRVRGPIYDAAADVHIENNSRKVIAAQQILEAF